MEVQEFLTHLRGVKQKGNGKGWEACCPAHDDQRPSLGVSKAEDGKILVNCLAGCTPESIIEALGLTMQDLFPANEAPRQRIKETYDYRDEAGKLLFQVVRFDPKDFRQRRPGFSGGWVWNLEGVRRVLYRLPELMAADPKEIVFIPEGEKDVENLWRMELVATTNAGGAGKWRKEYNSFLKGRTVVILPDNDQKGKEHAQNVAQALQGLSTVKILELPGLPDKGDVSDWIGAGGDRVKLLELVKRSSQTSWQCNGHPPEDFPDPIPSSQLKKTESDQHWLWHGFLSDGSVTLFTALWKSGKTTLVSHLLKALQLGNTFCGLSTRQGNVLVITEESENRWADRRDQLGLEDHIEFLIRPFFLKPNFQRWLELIRYIGEVCHRRPVDLLVFDSLSNLWPVQDENDAATVTQSLMPLRELTDGRSTLLIHHPRKSGGEEATSSRGSGALPAWVDTILELKRFAPLESTDCRRILTGYGRDDETPTELVIELTDTGYISHGTKQATSHKELFIIISDILPNTPPGMSFEEIKSNLPEGCSHKKKNLLDALRHGVDSGLWVREGAGVRGHPFYFWRP